MNDPILKAIEDSKQEILAHTKTSIEISKKELMAHMETTVQNAVEESKIEILETIKVYSTELDKKFFAIDDRFEAIDKRFDKIEATMVTKDYLDRKLGLLRADMVGPIKRVDSKIALSTQLLKKKKAFSSEEADQILRIETFPRPS